MPQSRQKRAVEQAEYRKARIRAKVEHPFRVIKHQFGYLKMRLKGLGKKSKGSDAFSGG